MDGDAGFEKWELKGEWKSRICPRRIITEESHRWLQLYSHYSQGHLAFAGGALDQPAIYLQAMSIIGSIVNAPEDNG